MLDVMNHYQKYDDVQAVATTCTHLFMRVARDLREISVFEFNEAIYKHDFGMVYMTSGYAVSSGLPMMQGICYFM